MALIIITIWLTLTNIWSNSIWICERWNDRTGCGRDNDWLFHPFNFSSWKSNCGMIMHIYARLVFLPHSWNRAFAIGDNGAGCGKSNWEITAAPPAQKNSMAFICEFGNCRKKWKALGIRFHTPIRGVTFESKGALLEIFQGSDDDRVLIDENVNLFVDSI